MKAVVVGGTGAVGQHVVGHLLQSAAFESVVTVGRREVTVPPTYGDASIKLQQVKVNMDNLGTDGAKAFEGAQTVFCCLGTTRNDAGSAAAFKKVDYEFVKATAEAAKQGGAQHFSLVSAQGANANVWACDLLISAPLLYMKTKGLAEEIVKAQGFQSVSIYRPGLLDREDKMRGMETTLVKILPSLPVSQLAKLMVLDAAQAVSQRPKVGLYENSEIHRAVKEGRLCKS